MVMKWILSLLVIAVVVSSVKSESLDLTRFIDQTADEGINFRAYPAESLRPKRQSFDDISDQFSQFKTKFSEITSSVGDKITEMSPRLIEQGKAGVQSVSDKLSEAANSDTVQNFKSQAFQIVKSVNEMVKEVANSDAVQKLKSQAAQVADTVSEKVKAIAESDSVQNFRSKALSVADSVRSKIEDVRPAVSEKSKSAMETVSGQLSEIMNSDTVQKMKAQATQAADFIQELFN